MPKSSKSQSTLAALSSELSEYASLLRSIRTSTTLDITPQLQLKKAAFSVESDNDDNELYSSSASEEVDAPLNVDNQPGPSTATISENNVAGSKDKGKGKGKETQSPPKSKSKSKSTSKRKRKHPNDDDYWTKWPLLPDQCPAPEWSFYEEIAAIAEQTLRSQFQSLSSFTSQNPTQTSNPDANPTSDNEDEDIELFLPPAYLSGLSSTTASKLTSLLRALSFHRLNATWSKHGRVTAFSWQDVLDIAGISEIFDVGIIEEVQERMEAVFGASRSQVVHRMRILEKSREALAEAEAMFYDYDDFPAEDELHLCVNPHPSKKQKQDNDGLEDKLDGDDIVQTGDKSDKNEDISDDESRTVVDAGISLG